MKKRLMTVLCVCLTACAADDGSDGRDGRDGTSGEDGELGAEGPRGNEGDKGSVGTEGPQGIQGSSAPFSKAQLYSKNSPAVPVPIGVFTTANAACNQATDILITGGCAYTGLLTNGWDTASLPFETANPNAAAYWSCQATSGNAGAIQATVTCLEP